MGALPQLTTFPGKRGSGDPIRIHCDVVHVKMYCPVKRNLLAHALGASRNQLRIRLTVVLIAGPSSVHSFRTVALYLADVQRVSSVLCTIQITMTKLVHLRSISSTIGGCIKWTLLLNCGQRCIFPVTNFPTNCLAVVIVGRLTQITFRKIAHGRKCTMTSARKLSNGK